MEKIRVAKYFTIVYGADQSKAVQDYLFSKGKMWFDEQTYQYLHCEALFWSDEENYISQARYDWEAQEYEDECSYCHILVQIEVSLSVFEHKP